MINISTDQIRYLKKNEYIYSTVLCCAHLHGGEHVGQPELHHEVLPGVVHGRHHRQVEADHGVRQRARGHTRLEVPELAPVIAKNCVFGLQIKDKRDTRGYCKTPTHTPDGTVIVPHQVNFLLCFSGNVQIDI